MKVWPEIDNLAKNRNLRQKLKFWSKIQNWIKTNFSVNQNFVEKT